MNAGTKEPLSNKAVIDEGKQNGGIKAIVANSSRTGNILPNSAAQKIYIDNFRKTEAEIGSEINKAITEASKNSILYTAGFCLAAFLFSFGITNDKKQN